MKEKINSLLNHSFIRFIIVGGSATLLDYIIYWFLSMEIHFNIAKGGSMTCSCIYSYFMNKLFTFRQKEETSSILLLKYIGTQIINIGINTGSNMLVYQATGSKVFGMIFATGVASIVNYFLQKFLVFNIRS